MQMTDNPNQTNSWNDPAAADGQSHIAAAGQQLLQCRKSRSSFETQLPDSSNNNVSLLGMPAKATGCCSPNYSDKTLMRNYLAQTFYEKMGRYGPRMRHCELIIDGEYRGIYLLGGRQAGQPTGDIAHLDPKRKKKHGAREHDGRLYHQN